MKLLENSQFEMLCSALSEDTGLAKINIRLESYSCKMAGDAKRQYKQLEKDHTNGINGDLSPSHDFQILGLPTTTLKPQLSVSPNLLFSPQQSLIEVANNNGNHLEVPTGTGGAFSAGSYNSSCLNQIISKKTLFYLIATLNASFQPDYSYNNSNTSSYEFSKEPSLDFVIKAIENYLGTIDTYSKYKQQLWEAIDREIQLSECEFYSYNPDLTSDPCGEGGCLWFFNFFFYNKKMKRIVFLYCRCVSKNAEDAENESGDEMMMMEDNDSSSAWNYLSNSTSSTSNGVNNNSSKQHHHLPKEQPVSTVIGYMD